MGFRISGVFHQGSLLLLPGGPQPWAPAGLGDVTVASLQPAFAQRDTFEVLLLGTGARFEILPLDLRKDLHGAGLAIEAMATGAACRSFNVLIAEGRRVAAALIAVD